MSQEDDFRLSGVVNCYGTGTRSYNRSAEKREMDRQRKAITAAYINATKEQFDVGPICRCRSFNHPHWLSMHRKLRNDWDWGLPR